MRAPVIHGPTLACGEAAFCATLAAAFAAAFAATLAATLGAQARMVVIPAAPQCASCSIELTKVATVGSASDPVLFVNYTNIYRGPGNTFLVSTTLYASPPALLLYDSAGRFVRQIGRIGQGPGEFPTFVSYMGRGRADSLAFRERMGRVQVFSPAFEFGRVVPTFGISRSAYMVLPNGNFIEFAGPERGVLPQHPIQLLDPDGAELRTFGSRTPDETGDNYVFSTRYASLSRERDRILVARRNQYEIQRFTLDGAHDLTIRVEGSAWMAPWLTLPTAPFSSLADVEDAGNGRLWVLGRVPALGATTFIRPNTAAWPIRVEQNLSTVIDIVDTERGVLLASRRFEREIYLFIDGDHVVRQRQDSVGVITFDVYRIQLRE